ncbi:inorganic phosphate transporter [Kingella negevensis]|uniref:inorganic phosphate transporter n=1 Tax=Kingella negevensis TaxID=1522312 RepID=UPI00254DDEB7|nr:inorganic phosphate transporter [Kingella negevensis]MDK4680915.1 inorganic phosphate transporter [Kingella negevensis]MDK4683117.1 inorganic phosphate transporter [Kingella negevensis]MDK4691750.1 inorganic phosphate transporter [Kingella negevensis]MDK4693097.1 inorganic phosphate transporter [Kingella negevensis]MDK4699399.1 inorganic phosphate transporter [Kingella negevensis]
MSKAKSASPAMPKTNAAFAILFVGMVGYFIYWGLGYTQYHHSALFLLATAFGVFMAFNIGGNDVANSFGTSVGAGTLTVPQALLIASVFEVSGAVIAGGEVTDTIRTGIVDFNALPMQPLDLVFIMMSALLAAALWLLFATKKGLPVSTTHAIIGGLVGSSIVLGSQIARGDSNALALVKWSEIYKIAISWVLSPALGGMVSFAIYSVVKKKVLDYNEHASEELKALKAEKKAYKAQHRQYFESLEESEKVALASAMTRDAELLEEDDFDPKAFESEYYKGLHAINERKENLDTYYALYTWVPAILSVGGMAISSMLIFKGLKNLNLGLTTLTSTFLILMIGTAIWLATFMYAKMLSTKGKKSKDLKKATFAVFSWMQVVTASSFAFSHGANDIANAIGPFAAIMDVIRANDVNAFAPLQPVVMLTFGVALIVGLWFIGKEVIQTVGQDLAELHPSSGFTAELSAASVVMAASVLGLPVSSTHILVGAVLGIGMVNRNANWKMMKPIGLAWVITLPAAAMLSIFCFLILQIVF